MGSITVDGMKVKEISELREKGWHYVALFESRALKDTLIATLLFLPLPKKGEYVEIPGDSYKGRSVSFFLHPCDSPFDLYMFMGDAVH